MIIIIYIPFVPFAFQYILLTLIIINKVITFHFQSYATIPACPTGWTLATIFAILQSAQSVPAASVLASSCQENVLIEDIGATIEVNWKPILPIREINDTRDFVIECIHIYLSVQKKLHFYWNNSRLKCHHRFVINTLSSNLNLDENWNILVLIF